MKSARERAIEAVHEALGSPWNRTTFDAMLVDPGGDHLRKLVAAFERTIEADRKACRASSAPS